MDSGSLYGSGQSWLARYLQRRERRRPDPVVREHRRRLLAGLEGRVIEVGCGDGRNFELYPASVELVLAVEPDSAARAEATRRAADCATPIEVIEGSADRLPVADAGFDAAVSCWLLCSVYDQAAALRELRRVLGPAGELRFYEHVCSRNRVFLRLQRLVDILYWPRLLAGCRTALDSERVMRDAGFEILKLERLFHSSSLLTIPSAPHILGAARRLPGR
ncbi:MAG TPA: class I SAM-dependent methyltransferase [Gaiellaceae bacterium]